MLLRGYISHGKNDLAEGSKILLDTDLKIILLTIKNIMSNASKNVDILATSLSVLHNYFQQNCFFGS